MIVTGIEVISRNPGVAVTNNPGSVEVAPPEKLELTYGDILRITTGFNYRGPAIDATLYGAIGEWHPFPEEAMPAYFDEIIAAEATLKTPNSPMDFAPVTASVDIPITAAIPPGTDYDLYAKLTGIPGADLFTPKCLNVIDITGIPPTYELIEETIYPYAYVYDGPHEGGTITFRTDPFTPASWIAGRLAARVEDEIKKAGGRMLEMRVYVDKSPLLWADWQIDVISAPPKTTAGLGVSVGIAWWAIAILAALAIILIIVITWAIKEIAGLFTHKAISPELKEPMSRETLTTLAHDYEAKLEETKPEFTPKPPEEIEAMSDDELRDYCDQLAEWIVPPPVPIPPWVVLAVLGALGVGGIVAAYAMTRPKE